MQIKVEKNNQTAVVRVEGRLDTVTAPLLDEELNGIYPDIQSLVLDMQKLEYVSSAGLRVLLSAQKKMAGKGGMKLVSVCETVMEVFEITGFADILTVE